MIETYLDQLVPASRDDDGVLGVGGEADAGHPLSVALVGDGELAVAEGVPQLDGSVAGSGDNLSVVGGEGDGEDVVGVADESAGGGASGKLPQAKGLVPRGRQGVSTIRRDNLPNPSAQKSFPQQQLAPSQPSHLNVRSRTQCGSGRGEIASGNRTETHRG